MSEARFTKAPWRLTRNNEWIVGRDETHGDVTVAKVVFNPEADAPLLNAAPEMYEMLQDMLNHSCRESCVCCLSEDFEDRIWELLTKARGGRYERLQP